MFLMAVAWLAYVFLASRVLFHGLRFGDFFSSLIVLGVLFLLLVLWPVIKVARMSSRARRAAAAPQTAGSSATSSSSAEDSGSVTFRVAGTTFDNDDGSSRQEILRHMKYGDAPWADDPDDLQVTIEEETYEGQLAFSVFINGYQVGFVPKSYIRQVEKAQQNISTCYVSEVEIIGGGTADDGRKLSYGCRITLEY